MRCCDEGQRLRRWQGGDILEAETVFRSQIQRNVHVHSTIHWTTNTFLCQVQGLAIIWQTINNNKATFFLDVLTQDEFKKHPSYSQVAGDNLPNARN